MSAAGDCCARCCYVHEKPGAAPKSADNPEGVGFDCRRFPPGSHIIMVAGPKTPGNPNGVQPAPMGLFPPTNPGSWCGEFAPLGVMKKASIQQA